jgi:hypothetical protein
MVGASFTVAAVAEVLRRKVGISANGNAQVSTAQSKFGGASLLLDGTGDWLETTGVNISNSDNFTCEAWIRLAALPGTNSFSMFISGLGTGDRFMSIKNISGTYVSDIVVYDGTTIREEDYTIPSISTNTWYHWAIVKNGSTLTHYFNGTALTTLLSSQGTMTSGHGFNAINKIGVYSNNSLGWNGHLDEIRISNTARYTASFTAPTTPFVNDANTLLLIHANGTNASTFFEDDNGVTTIRTAKTITVNGNAQLSTAQEKFGQSSLLFDGTGDYLIVPASSDFNFGTGNFTIEMWFRRISGGAIDLIIGNRDTGFVSGNIAFYTYSSSIEFDYRNALVSNNTLTTSISNDTWFHFAVVRNGTSLTLYKDGAVGQAKTIGASETFGSSSFNLSIGCNTVGTFPLNGYIDELRISKVARYTTTFTAPSATFENDANTLLLIHAEGANASVAITDDNSGRASRSLIAIANAQIDTAQSKFGGSALLLDGTGDYVASPAGTQWDFGTSSFTIEFWIRFNAINTLYVPIALRSGSPINNGEWWCEIEAASNKMYWGFKNQAGTQFYVAFPFGNTAFATGQFYHIALVNNAGTAQLYINGTAQGSTTAFTGSFGNSTTDLWLGAGVGGYNLNGWLDEIRISNSARYTAAFTPSTTPFVNDANTLLLVHADGTDAATVFRDDNGQGRSSKGISANGNAQVDTAQSQFGGASLLLDGTGDYLSIAETTGFGFTADFTIEFWARGTTLNEYNVLYSNWDTSFNGIYFAYWHNANKFSIYINGSERISASNTLSTNTWYHIALVRSGSTLTLYRNGTSIGTGTYSGTVLTPMVTGIGINTDGGAFVQGWTGHMDEVRVSNTARYTAGFTPSTTPFQNDANTVLLLHCDGTDASTVFFDDNGIAPYTP